eukprot:6758161-Pyramimonas_sp.AAC.1
MSALARLATRSGTLAVENCATRTTYTGNGNDSSVTTPERPGPRWKGARAGHRRTLRRQQVIGSRT